MSIKLIFACVAAGAAVGMLMAPQSGNSTRNMISDKYDDLKERLYKLKNSGTDLQELKEVFKHEIAGLRDDTRKRVLEILQATRLTGNHIKEQLVS
ncbi:YtxH domain-containing protein [Lacibacter sp. H375]|jgi:gas vesicle protein|uniref:YtxH domain-containing protein n=1 Tax=Lacibacter sp. H375 TaxID=3133424 RepID=UPI0030C1A41C